jgi:putative ABC transport system permease protein
MRRARAWLLRLVGVFTGHRRDHEFTEELESHLAMHVEDNVRAGMTPGEARRHALVKLGGIEQAKETYRDRARLPLLDHLLQDVRVGTRMLRRNPLFTAVAVLTLGLGIGANAAIFSVVNAVLLRPLPYPDPERLVLIWATDTKRGATEDVASYPDVEDWKAQSTSFDGMAAFTSRSAMLAGSDQAELVPAIQVMPGFFEMLGVRPAIGRTFRADDAESRALLLSDSAWKRRFAGRADVLGQTLRLNEQTHVVIGVMPPDFRFSPDQREQVYTALARDPSRNHGFLRTVGRLRRGVSRAAAQADLDRITRRLAEQYPRSNQHVGANVMPLVDAMARHAKPGLLICLGVVAMVLLVACTNVANLLLSRNASRQKELALRTALGAGRRRLTQQLLTESLLIALAGGALGLLLSAWTAPLLAAMLADNFPIPRIDGTRTDEWVLGFTLVVSLATAVLFGGLHALAAASLDLSGRLRESGRTATTGARAGRIRSGLVIMETALALVLLAGAGSLLKSLLVMRSTAPGFTAENLLTVGFWLPKSKLANTAERLRFFENVMTRVAALPGVRGAALVANLPMGGGYDTLGFRVVGRPAPAPGASFNANFNIASPGYFRTMGIPLRAGREFTDSDSAGAPPVIVINETAAQRFWPGEDPLGRQITVTNRIPHTVVGIARDVRQMSLGTAPRPEIFLNSLQPTPDWPWLTLVVRTASDPASLRASIKGIAQSVDRNVPIAQMRTFDEVLSGSLAQPRVYTMLVGAFAALALLLAAVGLYGVVAYTASQRTHEMGVRQALGAARGDILRLVLRQGLALSTAGTALGLLCALAVTRLLRSLVPTVQPGDPLTLLAVSALLMAVAVAATLLPAERASRVDPLVALRCE